MTTFYTIDPGLATFIAETAGAEYREKRFFFFFKLSCDKKL